MSKIATCPICGKSFESRNKIKYCCDWCRKIGNANTQRAWRKAHPDYYNEWKMLRSASSKIFRSGNINFTGALQSVESNYFYGWCRDKFEELDKQQRWDYSKRDIISLRDEFRKDRGLT